MRNALAKERKCDAFSEIGLGCNFDEINISDSIEVKKKLINMLIDANVLFLSGEHH